MPLHNRWCAGSRRIPAIFQPNSENSSICCNRFLGRPIRLHPRRPGAMAEMGTGSRRCDEMVWSASTSFVEPDRAEVLIEVMARADLPAFDIGPVRHDPVPPQQ